MLFIVLMHECSPVEKLTRAAVMDHAGLYTPKQVGMMHECTPGELLAVLKGSQAGLCTAHYRQQVLQMVLVINGPSLCHQLTL